MPHAYPMMLDVAVDCTTGTYVRALARDLGVLDRPGVRMISAEPADEAGKTAVMAAGNAFASTMPPEAVPGYDPVQSDGLAPGASPLARRSMGSTASANRCS